jgi:hypothetical protein
LGRLRVEAIFGDVVARWRVNSHRDDKSTLVT